MLTKRLLTHTFDCAFRRHRLLAKDGYSHRPWERLCRYPYASTLRSRRRGNLGNVLSIHAANDASVSRFPSLAPVQYGFYACRVAGYGKLLPPRRHHCATAPLLLAGGGSVSRRIAVHRSMCRVQRFLRRFTQPATPASVDPGDNREYVCEPYRPVPQDGSLVSSFLERSR